MAATTPSCETDYSKLNTRAIEQFLERQEKAKKLKEEHEFKLSNLGMPKYHSRKDFESTNEMVNLEINTE